MPSRAHLNISPVSRLQNSRSRADIGIPISFENCSVRASMSRYRLADEPIASVLRGGERIQRLRDFATAFRKQTISRANDIRGFVVVEARAMTQERRNLRGFTGPEEFGLSQSDDGRVGRSGLRLDGHDAEAQFLEESLVRQTSRATEVLQPGLDGGTFRLVLGPQFPDVPIARLQGRR